MTALSGVTFVDRKGLRLATQAFGAQCDRPVVLIMGATASMLGWPDGFCQALAEAGHFVVRFDHRDTGQSTGLPAGSYFVEDMVDDVLAILDAYGFAAAHLVGLSLGGYVAQMLARRHPARVAALTLIASEPLGWDGPPLPGIESPILAHFGTLAALDPGDRTALAEFLVTLDRLCAAGGDFDADQTRATVCAVLDRASDPASMMNHTRLSLRDDWTGAFRAIACPVLVLHGALDPVLPLANGLALAQGIPGARLQVLADTGHGLPARQIPAMIRAITANGLGG